MNHATKATNALLKSMTENLITIYDLIENSPADGPATMELILAGGQVLQAMDRIASVCDPSEVMFPEAAEDCQCELDYYLTETSNQPVDIIAMTIKPYNEGI